MDLFTADQPQTEETLREELTRKWTEKFPTADPELIKTKVDSDVYVKLQDRRMDELRQDYTRAQEEIQRGKAMEELIERLNKENQQPAIIPEAKEITPNLDITEIEKLVDSRFEMKKRTDIENANFKAVQTKLQERFGNSAADILAEQSSTLGLTKEDVNALAKKSPEAFFRIMGLNNQPEDLFMSPPRSQVRNDNFAPKTVKRTWSWYQAEKAKNPTWYWDPKTQLQMHQDSDKLGDAFEDGNFNS